jgi:itaconate CoA-transferase
MAGLWATRSWPARGAGAVDTPAGPVPTLLPPGSLGRWRPALDAVPALGQHTDAILAELGLAAEEIARPALAQAI